ncbi:MAG: trypsin-like serine protease [Planctomycetaceae bacterium]|nr:trypsin-like serine protease [Planctomycetaceae bacterium]
MKREKKRITFEVLEDRITLSAAPLSAGISWDLAQNDALSQTASVSNALASIEVIPVKVENAGIIIGKSKPTPDTDIEVGDEYYLEIWVTDLSTATNPSGGTIATCVAVGLDSSLVEYIDYEIGNISLMSLVSPAKTLSEGYVCFQFASLNPYSGVLNNNGACFARILVQAIAPSSSITFDVMQDTSVDDTILFYAQANNFEVIDDSLITIIPAVVQQTGDPLFIPSSTQTGNTEIVSSNVSESEVTETESVITVSNNDVPLQEEITWTEHVTPEDLGDVYVPDGVDREIFLANIAEFRSKIIYTQTSSGKIIKTIPAEALQLLNTIGESKLFLTSSNPPVHHIITNEQYTGVVRVEAQVTGGISFGTGSLLLSGNHVLTAAHVVTDDNGNTLPASTVSVTFALPNETVTRYVTQIIVNPGYIPNVGFATGADLAIIELSQPAPDAAERYDIYRGTDEDLNAVVTKVGYGSIGTGNLGTVASIYDQGYKLAGKNTYDDLSYDIYGNAYLISDFDDGTSARDALGGHLGTGFANEVCAAPGDSGGPGFITTGQGQIVIAGITRGGMRIPSYDNNSNLDSSFGELFCDLRITNFKEWIDSIAPPTPEITLVFRDYSSQIVNTEVVDLSTLADRLTFIDEWSNFQVEIWGNTKSSIGISEYTVALDFPPNVFDVRNATTSPAFSQNFTQTQSAGKIVISGKISSSASGAQGDNTNVLLAQVAFKPVTATAAEERNGTKGITVPLNDHGTPIQPNENGFSVELVGSSIKLTSGQTNLPVKGFVQNDVPLYGMMFDVNDDGIVNVNDFLTFLKAYNKSTTDTTALVNTKLFDYNFDGIVNVNDFLDFLKNYRKSRTDAIDNPSSSYITYTNAAKNYFTSTSISQTANVSGNQQNAQDQAILDYIDEMQQLLFNDLSERVELSETLGFFEEIVL